ncbi:MAG: Rieske 2Fe-2S domain-containing protein [Rhodospirillales bacterium]|nr:Rieske 2Fe-2S domain-containing protein [Rhodospirillales bacterium]
MSAALDYLLKARPEAMGAYFAFLKDAGTRLDPKTRNLISVITKVSSQTERGLKQYLSRALREGCSAEEVIDALLMAFPALGLAKIIWAVDVILAMNLPEFSPERLGEAARWRKVAPAKAAPLNKTVRIEAEGKALFLHRTAKEVRAFDSRCPHQGTDMPELALTGAKLVCPKHKWVFDAKSGACIGKGHAPMKSYPAKIEKGSVLVAW